MKKLKRIRVFLLTVIILMMSTVVVSCGRGAGQPFGGAAQAQTSGQTSRDAVNINDTRELPAPRLVDASEAQKGGRSGNAVQPPGGDADATLNTPVSARYLCFHLKCRPAAGFPPMKDIRWQ